MTNRTLSIDNQRQKDNVTMSIGMNVNGVIQSMVI